MMRLVSVKLVGTLLLLHLLLVLKPSVSQLIVDIDKDGQSNGKQLELNISQVDLDFEIFGNSTDRIFTAQWTGTTKTMVLIKTSNSVIGFTPVEEDSTTTGSKWTLRWQHALGQVVDSQVLPTHAGIVDLFGNGDNVFLMRGPNALRFYKIDATTSSLKLVAEDGRFHAVYGWNDPRTILTWGNIFTNKKLLGILTRNLQGIVNIYAVDTKNLNRMNSNPLLNLDRNISTTTEWHESSTSIFTVKLKVVGAPSSLVSTSTQVQDHIVVWSSGNSGLQLYQFDKKYSCILRISVPHLVKDKLSKILFASITNSIWNDLLYWNPTNGLTIYQYHSNGPSNNEDFVQIAKFHTFTSNYGWTLEHMNSIHAVDLDQDGKQELVVAGPNNLEIYTFNFNNNSNGNGNGVKTFRNILQTEKLPSIILYSIPIGVTTILRTSILPILFFQDHAGKVYSATAALTIVNHEPRSIDNHQSATTTASLKTRLPTVGSQILRTQQQQSAIIEVARSTAVVNPVNYNLHWLDKWGNPLASSDLVDSTNGHVRFQLPLFDQTSESELVLSMSLWYNSAGSPGTGAMGNEGAQWLGTIEGWSIPLLDDYIVMDYNILPEYTTYTWQSGSFSYKLSNKFRSGESKGTGDDQLQNEYILRNSGSSAQKFIYNAKLQTWTRESDEEISIYSMVQWSITGHSWSGPFEPLNDRDLVQIPVKWYVSQRTSKRAAGGHSFLYLYESEYEQFNQVNYTTSIRLVGINQISGGRGFSVKFVYGVKNTWEYFKTENLKDDRVSFPKQLIFKWYLSQIEITCLAYHHLLSFDYKLDQDSRQRRFVTFRQTSDGHRSYLPLMTFDYNLLSVGQKSRLLLTAVEIESLKYEFMYEPGPRPMAAAASLHGLRHPINDQGTLIPAQGYVLSTFVVHCPSNYVVLQIMSPDASTVLTELSTQSSQSSAFDPGRIIWHYAQPHLNSIFLVMDTNYTKWVTIFKRDPTGGDIGSWNSEPEFSLQFAQHSVAKVDQGLIAVHDPETPDRMTVFKYDDGDEDARSTKGMMANSSVFILSLPVSLLTFAVHTNMIIGYNDQVLTLFMYQQHVHKWTEAITLDDPNINAFISDTNTAIDAFDISTNLRNRLYKMWAEGCVQVYKNLIIIHGIRLIRLGRRQHQLQAQILLILLDNRHEISKIQLVHVDRDSVLELSDTVDDGDGSKYEFKYEEVNGKYRIKINSISGKVRSDVDAIGNKNIRADELEKRLKALNNAPGWKKQFLEISLVKWSSYNVQVLDTGSILVGGDRILRPSTSVWKFSNYDNKTTRKAQLSSQFVLESDLEGKQYRIKSRSQDKTLNLNPVHHFINRWPLYVAYQVTPTTVGFLPFQDGITMGNVHHFENEQLHSATGYINLITRTSATSISPPQFIVRPMSRFIDQSEPVVKEVRISNSQSGRGFLTQSRVTGYTHALSTNNDNGTMTKTVIQIPGGNKNIAGSIETSWTMTLQNSGHGSKGKGQSVNWKKLVYDSDGNLVREEKSKQDEQILETKAEDKDNDNGNSTAMAMAQIFDSSNRQLILDLNPYTDEDEMIDFIGFESYESHRNWIYEAGDVVDGEWAFTGHRFLRISAATTSTGEAQTRLSRTFTPRDQLATYTISAWVRIHSTNQPTASLTILPYLRAIVKTTSRQAMPSHHGQHELYGIVAEVKHVHGDWAYVELALDLSIAQSIYEDFYYSQQGQAKNGSGGINPENNIMTVPGLKYPRITTRLSITVQLDTPPIGTIIDIDHVAFYPIGYNFMAKVYNTNGQSTAEIQTNGQISRTYLNRFGTKVATWSDQRPARFEQLVSHSMRTTSAIGNRVPRSKLLILPETGVQDTFDEYSIRNCWNISSYPPSSSSSASASWSWSHAPGQLRHVGNGFSSVTLIQEELSNCPSFGNFAVIRLDYGLESSSAILKLIINNSSILQLQLVQGQGFNSNTNLNKRETQFIIADNTIIKNQPSFGELILLLAESRIIVWVNGNSIYDANTPQITESDTEISKSLRIEAGGSILIENVFFLNNPQIEVTYYNELNQPIQSVQLESSQSALVQETIYDDLGRTAITTKVTRIRRTGQQHLLSYYVDFIKNRHDDTESVVSGSNQIDGLVHQFNPNDFGFPFSAIVYEKNPLNLKKVIGQPGSDFNVDGRYAQKFTNMTNVAWVHNVFPIWLGYRHESKLYPNGKHRIYIFDQHNRKVGVYMMIPGYIGTLATYEYNDQGQLVRIVPPIFHTQVGTLQSHEPYSMAANTSTTMDVQLKAKLSTEYVYNDLGRLTSKSSPDTGTTEFLYTRDDAQLRFMLVKDKNDTVVKILYFYTNSDDQLERTGHLTKLLNRTELEKYLSKNSVQLPDEITADHQTFFYSDKSHDMNKRGGVRKRILTQSGHNRLQATTSSPVIDELQYNLEGQLVTKRTISSTHESTMKKEYNARGQVSKLVYPDNESTSIEPKYNKLGQLILIQLNSAPLVSYTYTADGQVAMETHHHHHQESVSVGQVETRAEFTRNYEYNSPGWLEQIQDPFMTQSVTYTSGGYGQDGYGEGIVMSSTLKATWQQHGGDADPKQFRVVVNQEMLHLLNDSHQWETCIRALKRTGHLDSDGTPLKIFNKYASDMLTISMPMECDGEIADYLSKLINQKFRLEMYGYSYAYGSNGELMKAKYFANTRDKSTGAMPLGPKSFATALETGNLFTATESISIWNQLKEHEFLHEEHVANSIFLDDDLKYELGNLSDVYVLYTERIKTFILHSKYVEPRNISLDEFQTLLIHWSGFIDKPSPELLKQQRKAAAGRIFTMLKQKHWFTSACLNPKFHNIVRTYYEKKIAEIIRLLVNNHAQIIGQNPFDYTSYQIDGNGNHQHFYSGSSRYNLTYSENTNKINMVHVSSTSMEKSYEMKYENDGNVVHAAHKNIQLITYDPVSNRPMSIHLFDGRMLRFTYDSHGERILKEVYKADGDLDYEIQYGRDEFGRTLFENKMIYLSRENQTEIVDKVETTYIYGPRGSHGDGHHHLIAFIRNKKLYKVLTDHSGSIRLIIRNGKPIVAYDYEPYGKSQRCYGCENPQNQLNYKFTGQEYDDECELYNFHARFYDPELGRFYMIDPRSQYLSPYLYAGNSPISMIDPDGEEAITLIVLAIFGGLIGGYFGGAAANNRWNPADWDFNDKSTYIGMTTGTIAGAFLPIGFGASAAAIGGTVGVVSTTTLGIGGGYLLGAHVNQNWNPGQWAWEKPSTYSALHQGFAAGSSLPIGISGVHKYASRIFEVESLARKVFLGTSYTLGGGVAYTSAVLANEGRIGFWEWAWENPATLSSLFNGFNSGFGWTTGFTTVGRGLSKNIGKLSKNVGGGVGRNFKTFSTSVWKNIKSTLRNPKSPFYKFVAGNMMAYLTGSMANNDFDITRWNFASFTTYEGVLNGAFMGKDLSIMLRQLNTLNVGKVGGSGTSTKSRSMFHDLNRLRKGVTHFIKDVAKHNLQYALEKLLVRVVYKSDVITLLTKMRPRNTQQSTEIIQFRNAGLKSFNEGKATMPKSMRIFLEDQLPNTLANEKTQLSRLRRQINEEVQSSDRILLDRDTPEYIQCTSSSSSGGGGVGRKRRRKRVTHFGCNLAVTKVTETAEANFANDLIPFLSQTPLTTRSVSIIHPILSTPSEPTLQTFKFASLVDGSGMGIIIPKELTSDTSSIQAYWVGTGQIIELDPFNTGIRILMTTELQGCSLYARYNDNGKTASVYHHHRRLPGSSYDNYDTDIIINKDGKYEVRRDGHIETFDDVLAIEEYQTTQSYNSDPNAPVILTSAFLYLNPADLHWYYVYQRLQYKKYSENIRKGQIADLELMSLRKRRIKGMPRAVRDHFLATDYEDSRTF